MPSSLNTEYLQDLAGTLSPVTGKDLAAILRTLQADVAPGLFTESYLQDLADSTPAVSGRDIAAILRAIQVELSLSLFTEEYLRDLEQTSPSVFGAELVVLLQAVIEATAITYATWDPADKTAGVTLSNGNLTAAIAGFPDQCRATISKTTGKWYWEITADAVPAGSITAGVRDAGAFGAFFGGGANDTAFAAQPSTNNVFRNGGVIASGAGQAIAVGAVIGVALNLDANTAEFFFNGVSKLSVSVPDVPQFAVAGEVSGAVTVTANFGATSFAFPVPPGFNAGLYS